MPFFLRKVKQSNWLDVHKRYSEEGLPSDGDIDADPIGDLETKHNSLSVWLIEDDESNLEDVVAAVAVGRKVLNNFDCILFEPTILDDIGIAHEQTTGSSQYPHANENWHLDLVGLSGFTLVKLARKMVLVQHRLFKEREVKEFIQKAVMAGTISKDGLPPDLSRKVFAD